MKLNAYLDLIKSNMDVVTANVTMAMEALDEDNKRMVERVFQIEKENMRSVTEARMMREENNHLKAEVIKLLDTIGKTTQNARVTGYCDKVDPDDDCCDYFCECPEEFNEGECPDCGCCKDHYKAMESGN